MTLSNKTALVTGGAHRLGRAICLDLAGAGADIVVHYRDSREAAEEVASLVVKLGRKAWIIKADLENADDTGGLLGKATAAAGRLDILVNNASIFDEDSLDEFPFEALDLNVRINAFAPLVLSRAFAAQGNAGVIVNLLDSRVCSYDNLHASYHLSKRMLFSLTKMCALEFAPRVRVNGVAPGLVLPPAGTDESYLKERMSTLPLQKHGESEHVAGAVKFLATNDFITGQVIYVDGGRHLKTALYG